MQTEVLSSTTISTNFGVGSLNHFPCHRMERHANTHTHTHTNTHAFSQMQLYPLLAWITMPTILKNRKHSG